MRYPSTDNINIHIYTTYLNVTNKYAPTYNIYTELYVKFDFWKEFLWRSHLSFTEKQEFWKKLLLLCINGGFRTNFVYFPFVLIYILTNKIRYRHTKCTFNHGGKCHTLSRRELIWLIPRRWFHARVNLCGTTISKIYHGLCGWYVLTVFNSTSDN